MASASHSSCPTQSVSPLYTEPTVPLSHVHPPVPNLTITPRSLSDKKGTNKYNVKCGQNLEQWEEQGWMQEVDPYGWFQWYCRFYLGRRSHDDERQIGRGLRCMGPTGRWRTRLANLVNSKKAKYSAASVSPVIRQTLQHWGYRLTQADYEDHCDNKGLSY